MHRGLQNAHLEGEVVHRHGLLGRAPEEDEEEDEVAADVPEDTAEAMSPEIGTPYSSYKTRP